MRRAAWVLVVAISISIVCSTQAPAGKSGIWKPADGSYNFYIQTYNTGSCVVIATSDGEDFYVFLEPNCLGSITTYDYFGKAAGIQLSYTGEDTATADLKIGQEVTKYHIEKLFEGDCRNGGSPGVTDTNSLGMTFVYIAPGTFAMGSPESERERYGDEVLHLVTHTQGFYLQTTEVTQGQWKAVMGSNPSDFDTCGDDCPVERVSWNDVQSFIAELNDMGEGTYRLPTEAEWEYAARAGSAMAFTNGGMTEPDWALEPNLDAIAWYSRNSGGTTHPVGQKPPNRWGVYGMHGNVSEWCRDWYGDYPTGSVEDPTGPATGTYRVRRGGSSLTNAGDCRSGAWYYNAPTTEHADLGFRLVRVYP